MQRVQSTGVRRRVMTKTPKNQGSRWSDAEKATLAKLADGNTPTRLIALKRERSEDAVRSEAQRLGVSLAPANRSPYGTAGKGRK